MQQITIRRRHVWVAITTHWLTEEQARRSIEDENPVPLTKDMVIGTAGPLCYVCELPWGEASSDSCPGEPTGRLADGTPVF